MNICRVPASHSHNTPPTVTQIPRPPLAVIEQGGAMLNPFDSDNVPAGLSSPKLMGYPKGLDEAAIIDVDAFEYENFLNQSKMSAERCEGYTMIFPDGKSPYTV